MKPSRIEQPTPGFIEKFAKVPVPRAVRLRGTDERDFTREREAFFDRVGASLMGYLATQTYLHETRIDLAPAIPRAGDPTEDIHELTLDIGKPVAFVHDITEARGDRLVTFGKYPLKKRIVQRLIKIQDDENELGNAVH